MGRFFDNTNDSCDIRDLLFPRGCSSGVERQLPKLDVAGSNPVARSNFQFNCSSTPAAETDPQLRQELKFARAAGFSFAP